MEIRLFLTLIITLLYSTMWEMLEKMLYGQAQHRTVDDIVMLLFIPIIWIATGEILHR